MRRLDLTTHRHGVCAMKREQINTYEVKNKSVTSEVGPIVLIARGGVGLVELCVHRGCHHGTPTPTSPRRHSTFLAPASPTCCQGNKRMQKKKRKKISMTFNFETVKKTLKGILKVPEKEMEIGLLITDSQPTPFYSPVILSAHVTVFLPFSVYRGTNARHH